MRPTAPQPAALLEPVQRGIERALLHLQDLARHLLQALGDRVAVNRPEGDDLQDQHVERALEQLGFRRLIAHTKAIYLSICRTSRCRGTSLARMGRRAPAHLAYPPAFGCRRSGKEGSGRTPSASANSVHVSSSVTVRCRAARHLWRGARGDRQLAGRRRFQTRALSPAGGPR